MSGSDAPIEWITDEDRIDELEDMFSWSKRTWTFTEDSEGRMCVRFVDLEGYLFYGVVKEQYILSALSAVESLARTRLERGRSTPDG